MVLTIRFEAAIWWEKMRLLKKGSLKIMTRVQQTIYVLYTVRIQPDAADDLGC